MNEKSSEIPQPQTPMTSIHLEWRYLQPVEFIDFIINTDNLSSALSFLADLH